MVNTMTRRCKGCGIILQDGDSNATGYTPNISNDLCQRCFKLKNYNVLTNEGVKIDNGEIITRVNKEKAFVLFLTDFLNLDEEVIGLYKQIKTDKVMVLTKKDLIPKNIKVDVLINNIKKFYDIKEDIILCSSRNKYNINVLTNICLDKKKIIMVGFTNAGKSSLINALVGSDITVSKRSNTTQDFIKLNVDGVTLIDAPGFISEISRDNKLPEKVVNPLTYQLKSNYYLLIDKISLNIKTDSNLTIYINNDINIERRRVKEQVPCEILVPSNSDIVLKGLGFIKIKNATYINISTKDYEIRPSIVGGNHE